MLKEVSYGYCLSDSALHLSAFVSWGFWNMISSGLRFQLVIGEIVPAQPYGPIIKISWGACHMLLTTHHQQCPPLMACPFSVGLF